MLFVLPDLIPDARSPASLPRALQHAIALEHATIPPYLYALYSLAPGTNEVIADLIREIVREEMLHMSLACNLLNAIGGHPVLDSPGFLAAYPGTLPGMAPNTVVVGLERFSLELVETVFLEIEEPEIPLNFPGPHPRPFGLPNTIGAFYRKILATITTAGAGIFTGDPKKQITQGLPELIPVHDVGSATQAINTIIEQGEGTEEVPFDPRGDLAHYYKFNEICHGCKLIANPDAVINDPPDKRFIYDGDAIPFAEAGVLGAPKNPKAKDYAPGTAARRAIDNFNYTYTSLLKALHVMVNGHPESFSAAFGLMFSLQEQAMGMMAGKVPKGPPLGPTFEYLPALSDGLDDRG